MAALVVASDGSAAPKLVTVTLTATGPSPGTVRMQPLVGQLEWVNNDPLAHTVDFANERCSLTVPPGGPPHVDHGCGNSFLEFVGNHSYTEDGSFPGKVDVVGFARSVSLTARTHSLRRGSQLTLHGQLTEAKAGGGPYCGAHQSAVWILRRHDPGNPFQRILQQAAVSKSTQVRQGSDGCTYAWQLRVRPGERITYIAELKSDARVWKDATSRPFTVLIRH